MYALVIVIVIVVTLFVSWRLSTNGFEDFKQLRDKGRKGMRIQINLLRCGELETFSQKIECVVHGGLRIGTQGPIIPEKTQLDTRFAE